jgi:phage anti-repressor protein
MHPNDTTGADAPEAASSLHALIPVDQHTIGQEEVLGCNGRDLHAGLKVRQAYAHWARAQIKRARLKEGRDYLVYVQDSINPQGGRPTIEHVFSLDASKHIAMMSGTEPGYVREYFLDCERRAHASTAPVAPAALPSPTEEKIDAILHLAKHMAAIPGVRLGILQAQTLRCIEAATGLPVHDALRLALPAPQESAGTLNATEVGEPLGIGAIQANLRLQKAGFQVKTARGRWQLTEAGRKWAEMVPLAAVNGHVGYQIKWRPEVVEVLKNGSTAH